MAANGGKVNRGIQACCRIEKIEVKKGEGAWKKGVVRFKNGK